MMEKTVMGNLENVEKHLSQLKALSDITRLEIINLLSSGSLCACDILESFQITQPTLSYHMKLLTDSNLVTAERVGKWTHYSLNGRELDDLLGSLKLVSTNRIIPLVKSTAKCGNRGDKTCKQ
jgi:ArsR family transcriptional regulator, arsenate/arsenite/antimonite-responsive transcriptional repressor